MDFPSNSKNPRPSRPDDEKPEPQSEEKVIEPVVVEGAGVRRKKPLGRRFLETFFSGEAPKSVMFHVATTVLIPAAKEMIRDAGEQALDRILWGGRNGDDRSYNRRSRSGSSSAYISYGSASSRRDDPRDRPGPSRRARAMHDFDEIVLSTRAEANEVIHHMYDLLSRYEQVTVAEFYRLTHNTPDYTDENYGWKDLRGVEPRKVRDGYIVDLPRPEHLK